MPEDDQVEPLASGAQVDGYRVRTHLHTGVNGSVYAATNPTTGEKVAVKVIHPHLGSDEDNAAAFVEDVGRVGCIAHPGIVRVRSVGRLTAAVGEPLLYVVTEFVHGRTLADLISAAAVDPLRVEDARRLLAGIALVLDVAHGHGLVHGDLKPDNVFLIPRTDGAWPPQIKIGDFGLWRLLQPSGEDAASAESSPLSASPYHLSPEQCAGNAPSPAADVYALGVLAYQVLSGRLPHASPRPTEVMRMHREGHPVRPLHELSTAVDPATEAVVRRAMARIPGERHGTMLELRAHLLDPTWGPAAADEQPAAAAAPQRRVVQVSGELEVVRVEPDATDGEAAVEAGPDSGVEVARRSVAVKTAEVRSTNARALGTWAVLWLALVVAGGVAVYRMVDGRWPWQSRSADGAPAMLEVSTEPQGAVVYLDGVPWHRKTPVAIPVRRGRPYEVSLFRSAHQPWRSRIALGLQEEKRRVDVELVRSVSWGTLQITSSHKADVFLDSRRVGTQTTEVNLAEVRAAVPHVVKLVAPGFETVEQRVRVEPGKVRVLRFELQRTLTPRAPTK